MTPSALHRLATGLAIATGLGIASSGPANAQAAQPNPLDLTIPSTAAGNFDHFE